MRTTLHILVVALLTFSPTGMAQSYRMEKSTIDSGGGTSESADGRYQISGTIGQPDAGPSMSGGRYAAHGGFWAGTVQVVQMEDVPELRLARQGSVAVVLSWEDPHDRFALQQSSNNALRQWTNSAGAPNQVEGTKSVVIPISAPRMFFRLRRLPQP